MTIMRIDVLNTFLLFISFGLAYFLPFHLFLFAYAVLGPLHYLTEISWLKERNFFTQSTLDARLFMAVSLICVIALYIPFKIGASIGTIVFSVAFLFPVLIFLTSRKMYRIIGVVLLLATGVALSTIGHFIVLFAIFLPTLIHVFIFTALFMLYGAQKSKSSFGYINVVLLFIFGVLFFFLPTVANMSPSPYVVESYENSFIVLHEEIGKLFDIKMSSRTDVFLSEWGISIMQFIAFAYTYHYLNWFSKTKVVGWHESAKKNLVLIVLLWIFSVSLYAYSYLLGLVMLSFLSVLHVVLEFPLNHRTIWSLGDPFRKLLTNNTIE